MASKGDHGKVRARRKTSWLPVKSLLSLYHWMCANLLHHELSPRNNPYLSIVLSVFLVLPALQKEKSLQTKILLHSPQNPQDITYALEIHDLNKCLLTR